MLQIQTALTRSLDKFVINKPCTDTQSVKTYPATCTKQSAIAYCIGSPRSMHIPVYQRLLLIFTQNVIVGDGMVNGSLVVEYASLPVVLEKTTTLLYKNMMIILMLRITGLLGRGANIESQPPTLSVSVRKQYMYLCREKHDKYIPV